MEEFFLPTRIVAGAGVLGALREFGARRLFLVTEPEFLKNGMAQQAAEQSGAARVEYFAAVSPTAALAAEGTARLRAFAPDLLAALGGGRTIDCAKVMAYFLREDIPLAAIPTTSGSGSEVTNSAVLTCGRARHPLAEERLRPRLAILDSDLLRELPRGRIAEEGFDVLTHAAEAYTAKGTGSFSDLYARESFRMAFAALPASFAGRTEVRLKVHEASAMAGIALSHAGLGLCHAVSHSLESLFQIPHGRLNAVLLPTVIDCNAHAASHRYAELARYAGMGGSTDDAALRNLKSGLLRLRKELGLPQTLAQAGIPPRQLRENMPMLAEAALEDPCCASNPIKAEEFLIRRILEQSAGNG